VDGDAARIAALIERLRGPDKGKVAVAHDQLRRIGRPAVAALMKVARPQGVVAGSIHSKRALLVIGSMGPAGVKAFDDLVEALGACGDDTFLPVLRAIGDLAPYSEFQGDPRLAERLVFSNQAMVKKFSKGNDRQRFQYEFNRFQQRTQVEPEAGMKAMITELERNRTHRREVAAEVLGRMGPAAKSAVPALVKALRKGAPVVGQIGGFSVPKYRDRYPGAGCDALVRIAPRDPRVAIAWGWQLENSPSEEMRIQAALRIGGFGARAVTQVRDLVGGLRDESRRVRHEVITALGMIGPGAKVAIAPLEKIIAGPDQAAAVRATAALRLIRK